MEKLDSHQIKEILLVKNVRNETLFDLRDFEGLLPLFFKMEFDDLKAVLSDGYRTILVNNLSFFKALLPLFEKLPSHQFKEILSIQDAYGKTLAHYFKNEEFFISLVNKLEIDDLYAVLSIPDTKGFTVLYGLSNQSFLPLLEKLEQNQLKQCLSIMDKYGQTCLHFSKSFETLLPLLEKLSSNQLKEILSIQNTEGDNPLHCFKNQRFFVPLLDRLEGDDLYKVLSIQNIEGFTPLHDSSMQSFLPLLAKLEQNQIEKIFSIQNKWGQTCLYFLDNFKGFNSLLENLEFKKLEKLLTVKDIYGKPPLHNAYILNNLIPLTNFLEILPLTLNWSNEKRNLLFSIQDAQGNTLLHDPAIFCATKPAFFMFDSQIFEIKNNLGMVPRPFVISPHWFTKDKVGIAKSFSEEEYIKKAEPIKQVLDELWGNLNFGDNVPKKFLHIRINGENKKFSPHEIKEALDSMTEKIINKTPWLGTPPADQKEELRQFYSQMLRNFDQLLFALQNQSPAVQAGSLISVAKTQLEGRCAAAYQAEIEQANMLQKKESNTGVQIFDKKAQYSLINAIESIVRALYFSDSHYLMQMLYSTGLSPTPDPLSSMTTEQCQHVMLVERIWERFILNFKESSLNFYEAEFVESWLGEYTPEEYGSEFLKRQEDMKGKEKVLFDAIRETFGNQGIPEEVIESILNVFQSTQGAGLKFYPQQRNFVVEEVFQRLSHATSKSEIEDIQILHESERELDRLAMVALHKSWNELRLKERSPEEDLEFKAITEEKIKLQKKNVGVRREFEAAKVFAENRIALRGLLEKGETVFSDEYLDMIIVKKQEFDGQILKLARENEIDFAAHESGLPSHALEIMRRKSYANQFFDTPRELNFEGTIKILSEIGILEMWS